MHAYVTTGLLAAFCCLQDQLMTDCVCQNRLSHVAYRSTAPEGFCTLLIRMILMRRVYFAGLPVPCFAGFHKPFH